MIVTSNGKRDKTRQNAIRIRYRTWTNLDRHLRRSDRILASSLVLAGGACARARPNGQRTSSIVAPVRRGRPRGARLAYRSPTLQCALTAYNATVDDRATASTSRASPNMASHTYTPPARLCSPRPPDAVLASVEDARKMPTRANRKARFSPTRPNPHFRPCSLSPSITLQTGDGAQYSVQFARLVATHSGVTAPLMPSCVTSPPCALHRANRLHAPSTGQTDCMRPPQGNPIACALHRAIRLHAPSTGQTDCMRPPQGKPIACALHRAIRLHAPSTGQTDCMRPPQGNPIACALHRANRLHAPSTGQTDCMRLSTGQTPIVHAMPCHAMHHAHRAARAPAENAPRSLKPFTGAHAASPAST